MLLGDSYSSTSLVIANSIRNILYKAQISNAHIKFPTADMYGMRQGLRADMLPRTQKVVNFEDNRTSRIIEDLGHYITEDQRRKLIEDNRKGARMDV